MHIGFRCRPSRGTIHVHPERLSTPISWVLMSTSSKDAAWPMDDVGCCSGCHLVIGPGMVKKK